MGYPNKFIDYKNIYGKLDMNNSFFKNCLICEKFLFYDDIKQLYLPKDNDVWFMNAYDVNAYYSPSLLKYSFFDWYH